MATDDLMAEVIKTTVRESTKVLFTKKAEALGAETVGREAARYATAKGSAQTLVKVAGPLAGVVSTPVIEVALLVRDDEFHDTEDYVEAGMRGLVSGAAGAAGGIAGGAVPVVGPVLGPVAGATTSYYVNARLKESKALAGPAQQVVEVGESVAEVMSRTVVGAVTQGAKGLVKIATFGW
ncbi:hypothetical protein ACQB60_09815 [Actinomycetota bacterium Odt1-20B]